MVDPTPSNTSGTIGSTGAATGHLRLVAGISLDDKSRANAKEFLEIQNVLANRNAQLISAYIKASTAANQFNTIQTQLAASTNTLNKSFQNLSGGRGGGIAGGVVVGNLLATTFANILNNVKDLIVKIPLMGEEMYYMSRRLGTESSGLFSFAFASQMIGLSREQGLSSLESMGAALRTNPGLQALLKRIVPSYKMGGTLGAEDQLGLVNQLKGKFGEGGYFAAAQFAGLFGMDEGTFRQMWTNLQELNDQYKVNQQRLKDFGLNTEETDKIFVEFKRALNSLTEDLFDIGMKMTAWVTEHIGTPVVKATAEAIEKTAKTGSFYEGATNLLESVLGIPHEDTTVPSGGRTGTYTNTGNRQRDVVGSLMSLGLTRNEAIGGMTVFQNESGLNPHNINPHGGASGLMQWLGTRKENFHKMFGHYPHEGNMEEAIQFINWEGHGGEAQMTKLFKIMESNKNLTAGQSANLWRSLGERPEAWAYTGVATQAEGLARSGRFNDIDINHAGVSVTINGNIGQSTLNSLNSILQNDQKSMEARMRSAAEQAFR